MGNEEEDWIMELRNGNGPFEICSEEIESVDRRGMVFGGRGNVGMEVSCFMVCVER